MTCCTRLSRARIGNYALRAPQLELTGTWDFKWPLDTQIRVAFMQPDPSSPLASDFARVKKAVRQLAETWTSGVEKRIGFDWSVPDLPPRDANGRSQFTLPPDQAALPARNYDVLVSLDTLPTFAPDEQAGKSQASAEHIFLPRSELGSFARRRDYGVPTLYIGPIKTLVRDGNQDDLAALYENNKVTRFYVVHEFGHVLGLAHAHQDPLFRKTWTTSESEKVAKLARNIVDQARAVRARDDGAKLLNDVVDRLSAFHERANLPLLSRDEYEQFALTQLIAEWGGNVKFSDWPQGRPADASSVMDCPHYKCLLGLHPLAKDGRCDECDAAYVDQPNAVDHDWLRQLYSKAS